MHKDKLILKKIYMIVIIVLIPCFVISCTKKDEEKKEEDNKDPIPFELESIANDVQTVIEEIEQLQEGIEKPEKLDKDFETEEKKEEEKTEEPEEEEEKKKEEEKQKEEDEKKSDKEQDSVQEKEEDKEDESEEDKAKTYYDKIEENWEKIYEKVVAIHSTWNKYELKMLSENPSNELVNEFEASLNNLTVAIQERDDMKSLSYANEAMFNAALFLDNYKGNIDGELYKLRYYVRMSLINGQIGQWQKSKENLEDINPVFNTFRQKVKLEEKDQKLMEKLNLSIKDMQGVLPDEDKKLLKIKRDIALKNLKEIEKKQQ